jgi:4'-phosphopantetheinyl transferase EntD
MRSFARLARELAAVNIRFVGTTTLKTSKVLLPGEAATVAAAVPHRVREFATGRWCARQALARLGIAAQPLPSATSGAVGAPVWPARTCGSISHAKRSCCAVAAWSRHYRSLGIDLESSARAVSPEALALIANPDELDWLRDLEPPASRSAARLAGAKESAFKLLSPLVRRRFSFTALSLLPPATEGDFEFVLNEDLDEEFHQGRRFRGRRFVDPEWEVALCALPSAGSGSTGDMG